MEEIVEVEKYGVSEDNTLMSEFDDYVANDRIGGATSRALSYGFEVGDMVWGKVKSHPWWPGLIFNEAFASPSVRRTRRDGHILVAFFGDSSYGWFDPAELIPFEPHFEEKSQQINSRNFVRAVDEAVDEASRRGALGISCKCRNPYNFRLTNVRGYFAVDVPDYEPNGLYSANQISKARSSFDPIETLSFVKGLAVGPEVMNSGIEFIKNKARLVALRKAVFEEFDETYAQAFGVQPARPSTDCLTSLPLKHPPRAPLSGPLVIAEALGGGKSSKKPAKVKDQLKKDRYLLKRRDELTDLNALQVSPREVSSPIEPAYVEGPPTFFAGDYVLQKRVPAAELPSSHEPTIHTGYQDAGSSRDASHNDFVSLSQGAPVVSALDMKPYVKEELRVVDGPSITSGSLEQDASDVIDQKPEDTRLSGSYERSKPDHNVNQQFQECQASNQAVDSSSGGHLPAVDAKPPGLTLDVAEKKKKVLKRPLEDSSPDGAMLGKKKKKKRNQEEAEAKSDRPKKIVAPGKARAVVGNLAAKSMQTGVSFRENIQVNHVKRDDAAMGLPTISSVGGSGLELAQLLSDLHSLALNPFHGTERNSPSLIRQFFLRFRSLVFQKSLVISPPADPESSEVVSAKSNIGTPDNSASENMRDLSHSKLVRPLSRPDYPTKAGQKRLHSDRQEEIAAKKSKKFNQLKSLAAERKAGQRTLEVPRVEAREHPVGMKSLKRPDLVKKEPPAKAFEPTMLVMKFPPETSLPSVAELKARFGRFGSLDQSAIRVFWKSLTCRVVFRHKSDAQAAYRYANANRSLFGNVNVRCHLRTVEGPAADATEFDKTRDDATDLVRVKDSVADRQAPGPARQPLPLPAVQLKSCLKKPTGDEPAQVVAPGNGGKGTTPRVKFNLSGEETPSNTTTRGDQMMPIPSRNFNSNNNSNATSFGDGGTPSSVPMEFTTSRNFEKVIPQSPSPILPQLAKAPASFNNVHQTEVLVPRNSHTLDKPSTDISQQMLSLLTRCNDVVTNLSGLLGYVPYHPL